MIDVGQQLGGYTILERIGQGGMGAVFLAQHRRVARKAAVKVLVPELSQKAAVLERFFNEARGTSLIRHPGIVEILDCDVADGQAFIIMEFLEGENLGRYLHRAGPLGQDLPFFFGVGMAVAGAVGAAHAIPIIHRDLKPDNVYLHLPAAHDSSVTVKILDFGIAKLAQTDGGPSQTSTGMLLGTPAYMSPEQCRGAGRVDARSDVYSLGCILYEAICGRPPFVREGVGDLIVAHVSETPDAPLVYNRHVPTPLNALILRMLAKRPEDRPQTMDDVATELRACAERVGLSVPERLRPRTPVERPVPSVEPAGQRHATPAGGAGGTIPLVPRQASGPVPGPTTSRPTASLSPVPAARGDAALSGSVRGAGGPESGDVSAPQPVTGGGAGGTRVLEPARSSTTFSGAASEIGTVPRSGSGAGSVGPAPAKSRGAGKIVAAGAVILAGAITVILATRPKPPPTPEPTMGNVAPPSVKLETPPPPPPEPDEKRIPPPPAPPETVRIDIQGVPPRTTLTVDGREAALPLELPRGSGVHRVVLKPPGGAEKTLDIDGSRDRLIELVFEAPAVRGSSSRAEKAERSEKATDKSSSRRSTGSSRDRGEKKPTPGATDREAITDI